ncbi:MAG: tRNA pseudouridine synthase [Planctomycetota bacterium]
MPVPEETVQLILNPARSHAAVLGQVVIRRSVEDFQVEELPLYQPSGTGDHAWLWIEKRGLTTQQVISAICDDLRIRAVDVGVAGQKDRWAVTRQFVSIPGRFATAAAATHRPGLQVLAVTHHKNKLRTGHLRGNRFILRLCPPEGVRWTESDCAAVAERLQVLQQAGFPNYYGIQRFGRGGATIQDGLRLLRGRLPKDYWPENLSRSMTRLVLNAVQSGVFNLVLSQRVQDGTAGTPLPGDVVIRQGGIKPFLLPPANNPAGFIPAGPLPGPEMVRSTDTVLEIEAAALAKLGTTWKDFTRFRRITSGGRRKYLEFPEEATVTLEPDGQLLLRFTLTSGTYATALLRELAEEVVDEGGSEESGGSESSDSPDTSETATSEDPHNDSPDAPAPAEIAD